MSPSLATTLIALPFVFSSIVQGVAAKPHVRRQDASLSAAFSSMFAAGAYTANEHADGSTNNNLIIEKFLWSINNLRYQHDAPPLYWNVTLWEYATNWANTCPNSHSFGPYGETMGSGAQHATFDMNSFGEEASWDKQTITNTDEFLKSGHFFTEMWKDTKYFACARVWCNTASDGTHINNWISVCEYEYSAGVDGFEGNASARSNAGPPPNWDPPENHVSFTSFPPIGLAAQAWPAEISGTSIPNLGPTLIDLPPSALATASGVSFTGTTDSNTNPVVAALATPAPGPLGLDGTLPTDGPTSGSAVTPSGVTTTAPAVGESSTGDEHAQSTAASNTGSQSSQGTSLAATVSAQDGTSKSGADGIGAAPSNGSIRYSSTRTSTITLHTTLTTTLPMAPSNATTSIGGTSQQSQTFSDNADCPNASTVTKTITGTATASLG